MNKSLLIIFIKNPELGKVKTRLAKDVGDESALEVYLKLLEHTRCVTKEVPVERDLYYSSFIEKDDQWAKKYFTKFLQEEGTLGYKMEKAFEKGFERGYKSICIIGSDCYDLNVDILNQAFEALKSKDSVIGPAFDGGYYLLGMNKLHTSLFRQKKWSTSSVFGDTIEDLESNNVTYTILPKLRDIDTQEDLKNYTSLIK
ncbi:TIGR04282 family arsenosugar biosynthesis glycosyltransferase [Xanthovirga aplysinae]|uniref:TIGR04282 family arsenosugar biosynthesis glycosyltransferase n=1 Tax=Xanthovirga aplysinae TaxID=2529853 RepID=UPI0012BD4BE8|nr:TIGR04282 family arsenosugar biosynthesis glycosyltransferase [Xanthovirga aplysinae]MTI32124.1 glycosyltransferase [Xanthovirga aplysinae]